MKNIFLKISGIAIICIALSIPSYSQKPTIKVTENVAAKPSEIERKKVPKIVVETFFQEYPFIINENWYGYPQYDFFNDWYGYNPYLYEYNYPEYYIVEFGTDKKNDKAIYSKEGRRIATHMIVTKDLPELIANAILQSPYKYWKISLEKEEMYRNTEMDIFKVYKVEVENGTEKHHLYYLTDGYLLKDKTIIR